jgi:putative membrane protein
MTNKIALATALLLSTAVYAQPPSPTTTAAPGAPSAASQANPSAADLSAADKRFVEKAASGGLAEVQAAQLAMQKSQDQKVKDFAQKMITDHTAINQKLATLAQQQGLTVPTALDEKDQDQLDKLQKLDGAKFDHAYMKDQLKDHQDMLKLLDKEAKNSKDMDLKSLAEQTIPTIQDHLAMAKADTSS